MGDGVYSWYMNDTQKQSVLVVEDEAPAALALGDALEKEGFEVWRAEDGEAGLRLALEKHPDIMLVDLKLPKMGGMEMIRQVREDAWGKDARVIILTNVSDMESLEVAMKQETYYYLIKGDTDIADVVKAVRSQLAGKKKDI